MKETLVKILGLKFIFIVYTFGVKVNDGGDDEHDEDACESTCVGY